MGNKISTSTYNYRCIQIHHDMGEMFTILISTKNVRSHSVILLPQMPLTITIHLSPEAQIRGNGIRATNFKHIFMG